MKYIQFLISWTKSQFQIKLSFSNLNKDGSYTQLPNLWNPSTPQAYYFHHHLDGGTMDNRHFWNRGSQNLRSALKILYIHWHECAHTMERQFLKRKSIFVQNNEDFSSKNFHIYLDLNYIVICKHFLKCSNIQKLPTFAGKFIPQHSTKAESLFLFGVRKL